MFISNNYVYIVCQYTCAKYDYTIMLRSEEKLFKMYHENFKTETIKIMTYKIKNLNLCLVIVYK